MVRLLPLLSPSPSKLTFPPLAAQGYIVRDANGGGIATIDQLAGRTLTMDYSQPPAMGTDDDVYSFLDRAEPAPLTIAEVDPLGTSSFGRGASFDAAQVAPQPAVIPIKVTQGPPLVGGHGSPTSASNDASSSIPNDGVRTRSASKPQGISLRQAPPTFVPGVPAMGLDLTMGPPTQGFDINVSSRANSAPPTTPSWEAPGVHRGEYF
jgi:hypothetical protein